MKGSIRCSIEVYDRILVYGDRAVFDPIAAYGMSDCHRRAHAILRLSRACATAAQPGRRCAATSAPADLPLVAVSVGGGVDGGALLRAYLAGLGERTGRPLFSYVVTGPLLPGCRPRGDFAVERSGSLT